MDHDAAIRSPAPEKDSTRTPIRPIQAKLEVGRSDDPLEAEAERTAAMVVKRLGTSAGSDDEPESTVRRSSFRLQRSPGGDDVIGPAGGTVDRSTAVAIASSGGKALGDGTRSKMESAFGADFSSVRVHTGPKADELNNRLSAKAFTTGSDVFVRSGDYAPDTAAGQRLIAHELTHVVQQGAARSLDKGRIRRTLTDGLPDQLNPAFDPATFRAATYLRTAKRGESLDTIDRWLVMLAATDTWQKQYTAMGQLADATDHWIAKHAAKKKDASSAKKRSEHVRNLSKAAHSFLKNSGGDGGSTTVPTDPGGHSTEVAAESLGVIASGAGITGDLADVNIKHGPETYSGDYMDQAGAAKLNQAGFDLAEGANVPVGILSMVDNAKKFKEAEDGWEAAESGTKILAGAEQSLHGSYKVAKGIMILDNAESSTQATQLGDIGAAYADGTAMIAEFVVWMKNFHDAKVKAETEGGLTGKEKLDVGIEQVAQTGRVGYSGVKTALDITKAATEVGATEAIVGLATAAGAIGIIVGAIEIGQAIISAKRALNVKTQINEAGAKQAEMISEMQVKASTAKVATMGIVNDLNMTDLNLLINNWFELEKTYRAMQAAQQEYAPALKAMKQLQNRKLEEAAFKGAKGTMAIVGGAILLSGVGAPIGVAIAAIGGIIALGQAGMNLSRNQSASRLTQVARRLTDDGKPKGKPDAPSFRQMEGRIYAAYYGNLRAVVATTVPSGLKKGEFSDIKNFVWEEKRKRIKSEDKIVLASLAAVDGVNETEARNKWIQVDDNGTVYKEKPKGTEKVTLALTGSAHKSAQAMQASKEDIVAALYKLGSSAWNEEQQDFVDAPIVAQGAADPEQMAAFGSITLDALLSSADITKSRWAAWTKTAKGDSDRADPEEMKKLIMGQL